MDESWSLAAVDQPAASIVRKHRFDVRDGRDVKHAGPQGSGMWESLAVPSQMFSHAPELLRASLRLELARVFEKNLEPGSQ